MPDVPGPATLGKYFVWGYCVQLDAHSYFSEGVHQTNKEKVHIKHNNILLYVSTKYQLCMHTVKNFTLQSVCALACLTGQKICAVRRSVLAHCVNRDAHSYFSEGVHSNKRTKITENLKKISRICFNMTVYSYNRLKSEISTVAYQT